ncbi:Bug family tripartite tricarboxylate transporter substrate binding protein [Rhodoplanes sp. Z2-YC6860]|uniref:Bug family tripartite tricarboxylate transporter substrate binding protein n=1 Tax=Rhodoplanes sp. Z2-YC6860 TaxID=674703 RepID=UPI00078B3291|nr:tripartite tricarboxylate transporter substrate binding protein [Rhodoplanes sp. Z2-YC6860]AMN39917.1 ABC transporter substrate-binding protein [Rhodoplanes sp. Z2-YC6860]
MRKPCLILALLLVALGASGGSADEYPTRPIQVILPFAGGSGSDVIARVVLDRMGQSLGQRFVVENRPGAGGVTGTKVVTAAAPDGYTLVFTASGPLTVNKVLMDLPYDPERDFAPISRVAAMPNLLAVSTKLPVNSVAEFIGYAKHRPKTSRVTYSSVGVGSASHLSGAYFAYLTGIEMTHVPYRAVSQLVSDLISGEVPVSFTVLSNVLAPMQAGDVKALAVGAEKRMASIKDVPTLAEAGYDQPDSSAWFALLAPRGTPKAIVERLSKEVREATSDVGVRERLTTLGAVPVTDTPDELAAYITLEIARWRDVVSRTGIKLER